jgi:hypothetical protein
MTRYKIQTLKSLRDEMKAVARGERPAPADAAKPSFNSARRPALRSRRSSSKLIPTPKKTT